MYKCNIMSKELYAFVGLAWGSVMVDEAKRVLTVFILFDVCWVC